MFISQYKLTQIFIRNPIVQEVHVVTISVGFEERLGQHVPIVDAAGHHGAAGHGHVAVGQHGVELGMLAHRRT